MNCTVEIMQRLQNQIAELESQLDRALAQEEEHRRQRNIAVEKVNKLREALRFYADKKNHRNRVYGNTGIEIEMSAVHEDFGKLAMEALHGNELSQEINT